MKNFYLIYGKNKHYQDKEIKMILSKLSFSSEEMITYNLNEQQFSDVIEDAATISLFAPRKVILVRNADFFNKNCEDNNLLESYFEGYNSNNYLIFLSNLDKLDSRKKITKLFQKNGELIELKEDKNYLVNYIKTYIKEHNFTIDNEAFDRLVSIIGSDIHNINNELDKLFLLKEDHVIHLDDINNNIFANYEDEIYALTDAVIKKDKERALDLYYEFLNRNYDILMMLGMLSNQYRLLLQIKLLTYQGYNSEEIAKVLGVHPYRVKICQGIGENYELEELKNYLLEFSKIDQNLKQGHDQNKIGLELFILNL